MTLHLDILSRHTIVFSDACTLTSLVKGCVEQEKELECAPYEVSSGAGLGPLCGPSPCS